MMTLEEMRIVARNNSDGCGWAAALKDGSLVVRHSMDYAAIGKELIELWETGQIMAWIWHARLATHGSKTVENCHPFISPDGLSAMAHNGIFSQFKTPNGRVDSDYFAEIVLWKQEIDDLVCSGPIFEMIDAYVEENYSKVAIVSANASYPLAIFGEVLGTWTNGIWYSNRSCQAIQTYGTYRPTAAGLNSLSAISSTPADRGWWTEQEFHDYCISCYYALDNNGYCNDCKCCGLCGETSCLGCDYGFCQDCANDPCACLEEGAPVAKVSK
jgi:glutamine amidotransferase